MTVSSRAKFLFLAVITSTSCAEDPVPADGESGGSDTQTGPSTGVGGGSTNVGGTGGAGGAPSGGSAGMGGMPSLPPVPPCFPAASDDFSEPTSSEAKWIATNVEFQDGTAVLGSGGEELALLRAQGSLPQSCYFSFRIGAASSKESKLDAYVLLSPELSDPEEFADLDINVTDTHVTLYVRPDLYTEPQPRTGDQFLLIVSGLDSTLYQANAANTAWEYVNTLEMPHPLAETELSFVRYDTLPPFWVDDVTQLPEALVTAFPVP